MVPGGTGIVEPHLELLTDQFSYTHTHHAPPFPLPGGGTPFAWHPPGGTPGHAPEDTPGPPPRISSTADTACGK